MNLPLTIGQTSAGMPLRIDLREQPHLFVSYCHEEQGGGFVRHLLEELSSAAAPLLHAAAALTRDRPLTGSKSPLLTRWLFAPHQPHKSNCAGLTPFVSALAGELRRRRDVRKKEPEAAVPPLLILLDDFFDLMRRSTRSFSLLLLDLLLEGAPLNLHLVAASSRPCRHLFRQLASLQPALVQKFGSERALQDQLHFPLAAELVITDEELHYYRPKDGPDYLRLFPPAVPVPAEGMRMVPA